MSPLSLRSLATQRRGSLGGVQSPGRPEGIDVDELPGTQRRDRASLQPDQRTKQGADLTNEPNAVQTTVHDDPAEEAGVRIRRSPTASLPEVLLKSSAGSVSCDDAL
ncbi:hypothetical protein EYF80_004345 [Liparis tanakae]|uniref:Uncharacterized protein n=1 Tax=Liparis tanakae TaxID=230148 RepID=A0A4Z2J6Y6_9TELE|nr:hypothetical protein EYF80_004345 [Liparis tanakae]